MDLSINEGVLVIGGGVGDAPRSAINIKRAPRGTSAIDAEHLYLTQRFGRHGRGWQLRTRELVYEEGRAYDLVRIELTGGDPRTLYFDVTDWLARAEGLHSGR
ncbi:MAG TPA: hypothetical protein VH702_16440 [Vicinamibacterales bacterium]|jgi:hypothetical protein